MALVLLTMKRELITIAPCYELLPNQLSIVVKLASVPITRDKDGKPTTNGLNFRKYISTNLQINTPLKTNGKAEIQRNNDCGPSTPHVHVSPIFQKIVHHMQDNGAHISRLKKTITKRKSIV